MQTSAKQVIDMIFSPSTIAEKYECLLYSHRTQRVHWMQRVIMVLMSGPIFLSSTALFPSDKRLRSDPNCMDWSWKPTAIRHGSMWHGEELQPLQGTEQSRVFCLAGCLGTGMDERDYGAGIEVLHINRTWRSHSPPWSQMGQSSGWLANRNSITPSLQYKHRKFKNHSKQYHKSFSSQIW